MQTSSAFPPSVAADPPPQNKRSNRSRSSSHYSSYPYPSPYLCPYPSLDPDPVIDQSPPAPCEYLSDRAVLLVLCPQAGSQVACVRLEAAHCRCHRMIGLGSDRAAAVRGTWKSGVDCGRLCRGAGGWDLGSGCGCMGDLGPVLGALRVTFVVDRLGAVACGVEVVLVVVVAQCGRRRAGLLRARSQARRLLGCCSSKWSCGGGWGRRSLRNSRRIPFD